MQTIEFKTLVSDNIIHIPKNIKNINNIMANVVLFYEEENKEIECNYNKEKLFSLFSIAKKEKVFKNIVNSVDWQKEIRNEWE